MDASFLDYYNRELSYLREQGGEFAEAFPKIAARLGMHGDQVADPYVERLLEGFAFLTARIHLKMDAEFPRFSQRLLEIVYPHYLAPTPAMAIACIEPGDLDLTQAVAGKGISLPRGTRVESGTVPGSSSTCTFHTGQDVALWPIEVVDAVAELPGDGLPEGGDLDGVKGLIRLKLRYTGPAGAQRACPERLCFHIAADEPNAGLVYEAVLGHGRGVMVSGSEGRGGRYVGASDVIRAEGFAADQALLPTDRRVFQGYRLMHEYFAFPSRYLFFSIGGLETALRACVGDRFDIVILIDQDPAALVPLVGKKSFMLNCVTLINLFPVQGKRLPVTAGGLEHHVVPDRTRPLDYEVYQITAVEGFNRGNESLRRFMPFYRHVGSDDEGGAYFSLRRDPRRLSERAGRSGARSAYLGSEVFVSLVDTREAPWPERIEQIAVDMLLTNRDLPLLLPSGAVLSIDTSLPIKGARLLRGPSRPRMPVAEREMTWRLISHLSINYLALQDLEPGSGAALLRELLGLYGALADPAIARHAEAIVGVEAKAVNRRLPVSGPLVFGRGVAVRVTLDERAFAGGSPYLFGALLEQFLSRHVSMNMFCELALASTTRGVLANWRPRWGGRPDA